jgi:hypothetical protein
VRVWLHDTTWTNDHQRARPVVPETIDITNGGSARAMLSRAISWRKGGRDSSGENLHDHPNQRSAAPLCVIEPAKLAELVDQTLAWRARNPHLALPDR